MRSRSISSARRGVVVAALTVLATAACDDGEDPVVPPTPTIAELAASSSDLETLTAALGAADLVGTLNGSAEFTVFAPRDAAFDALPAGTLDALLASGNADVLADLLTYHVVPGTLTASDLTDGATLTTVEGGTLTVSIDGSTVRVGNATVVTADLEASNGVVHVVDGVLTGGLDVVERARITADLETLVSAVVAAELATTLSGTGPFTVFAPVDAAFAELGQTELNRLLRPENRGELQSILTYHVVPGRILAGDLADGATVTTVQGQELTIDLTGGAFVNGETIVATDILVSNGVVHLIDGVLVP